MPISILMWIMMLSLLVTYILLNILENKKMKKSERRLEKDRRQFTYAAHIPERRSGADRRLNYN
jgi:hypothetical protein